MDVSIIIPVYNVERYLAECLDSVCKQTLQNIEIICINDGSTDSSPIILRNYAEKDFRIKIINQQNKGYGKTVNYGIQIAEGEYVGIVEPDDYIDIKMMEYLYNTAIKEKADFVKADFDMFWGDGEKRRFDREKILSNELLYGKLLNPIQNVEVFWGWIANWAGIYKRDFLLDNSIRHNETPGASYQDQGFWFQIYANSTRAYFISKSFYRYRQDNPNASMLSKEKVYCIVDEYSFIYCILNKNPERFKALLPIYFKRKFDLYLSNYERIDDKYKEAFLGRISEEFGEHENKKELDLKYFKNKDKRILKMIINSPELYPKMYKYDEIDKFNFLLIEEEIWLYGAGKIAEETWNLLSEKNRNRVKGILVSNKNDNIERFHGISIFQYEPRLLKEKENVIVVIALSLKTCDIILKRLKEINFSNYIIVREWITGR